MIFKVAKFFIKMIIGIALGIGLGVYLVTGTIVAIKTANEDPHKNMSFVIQDYDICSEYPVGTWHACPVCGKNFYKQDINFCSHKCEKKYNEMKTAWDKAKSADEEAQNVLKKYGKKFK